MAGGARRSDTHPHTLIWQAELAVLGAQRDEREREEEAARRERAELQEQLDRARQARAEAERAHKKALIAHYRERKGEEDEMEAQRMLAEAAAAEQAHAHRARPHRAQPIPSCGVCLPSYGRSGCGRPSTTSSASSSAPSSWRCHSRAAPHRES
eukprot:6758731-Prymnesium_polylepis.1